MSSCEVTPVACRRDVVEGCEAVYSKPHTSRKDTTMTTTYTSEVDQQSIAPAAVGCAALGIAGTVFTAHDWGEIVIVATTVVVATALVFGLVVPRALRTGAPGKRALMLSIPAFLLTLPAFWSGLPLVLGVGGMMLGNAGRQADRHSTKAIVALVLGALAVLGYLGIYIGDGVIAGHVGFLWD